MKKKQLFLFSIGVFMIILFASFLRRRQIKNIINKLPKNGNWQKRSVNEITDITVHHSASPASQTAFDFARYHIKEKGWAGIGYHFVISQIGEIFQTNEIEDWTYHNGFNNKSAIGICCIGNFDKERMPPSQEKSLIWLIERLKTGKINRLVGHKEYEGSTACPGKNVEMDYLRKITNTNPFRHSQNQAIFAGKSQPVYDSGSKYADN